jgi:hypothetical protein
MSLEIFTSQRRICLCTKSGRIYFARRRLSVKSQNSTHAVGGLLIRYLLSGVPGQF